MCLDPKLRIAPLSQEQYKEILTLTWLLRQESCLANVLHISGSCFFCNMVSQNPYHQLPIEEVEAVLSDINDHARQPSWSQDVLDVEVPSTHLPLIETDPVNDFMPELIRSLSSTSIASSNLVAEQQDVLVKSWAILLHLYAVSDTIAFVVIGRWSNSEYTPSRASEELVVSRWSTASTSSIRAKGPHLISCPFVSRTHGSKVNTAVSFVEMNQINNDFSYVLHWSKDIVAEVSLYTQPALVPQKFASALWGTFSEVSTKFKSIAFHGLRTSFISRADQWAIRSFTPTPLLGGQLCLHQILHESARAIPHATAVQAWDGSLTYAELDKLSDNVAIQLISRGVRIGQYVPFSFEKSMWMIVAILGILKAGGAFVPIDPSQPQARAQEIVKETHADVVVGSTSQASKFADFVDTFISISSDTVHNLDEDNGVAASLPQVQPGNPATILYTSGSTGKPKGIIIEHSAISPRLVPEGKLFGYQGARTLQFAASTWDVFITEVFTTLTFRGCICMPSEEDRKFHLAEFCTEHNVTLAIMTPSLANLLDPETLPTLKTLIFGGEALRKDVVLKWRRAKGLTLNQGYGPAETGPCIVGRVADRPEILGHALDMSICVLVDPNDHDRLVPLGAVGELVVGGPGLLREYINNADKTAAAVIDNPPWSFELDTPVRRFYKTGDLLRYSIDTLDGRFEFVGRTDDQVKYHGQRIELGEIEHHLSYMPRVVSCVVTLVKKGYFEDKLVAVVQCSGRGNSPTSCEKFSIKQNANMTVLDVKTFLSTRLPGYMIPNELLVIEEMPRSVSMKLDRALVNEWISNMKHASLATLAQQPVQNGRLLAHESTARAIAKEYARIVAGDNELRRKAFEELDFNLQSGGIDSIQIMSLSMFVTRGYGVQVPMPDMLSSRSTVRTIASIIDANKSRQLPIGQSQPPDIQDEISLQLRSIKSTAEHDYLGSNVGRIFLTGASGFLGNEILRQLLNYSHCHVYALVRASSEEDAQASLVQRATVAGWWKSSYLSRVHVWVGDLSRAQLGLSMAQWRMLQGQSHLSVQAIIHNGAKVHYNLDYDSLKATNVSSTVELLKALNNREEPLHSFVYVSGGQQLSFDGRDDAKNAAKAVNATGYARSKVVSESVVKRFAQQQDSKARHVRVVKPGFIIDHSERGVANQTDFIWRLIAASIEMGYYNENDAEGWLLVADVNRVSQAVLRSVFEEDCQPVTKVLDGMRFKDLWKLLQSEFGYDVQPLPREEWLSQLRQSIAVKQEGHVMFPLMYMLEAMDESIGVEDGPSNPTPGVQAAMEANITHLIEVGFLPRPAVVTTPTSSEDIATPGVDAIDMHSVREHFPALHHGTVAFNNAGGTAVHRGAIEAAQKYMSSIPIELGQDDVQSQEKTQIYENQYKELAAFVDAAPDEIGKSIQSFPRIDLCTSPWPFEMVSNTRSLSHSYLSLSTCSKPV